MTKTPGSLLYARAEALLVLLARPARAVPLLVVLILLVYANSLGNGFHFDDEHSLVANPAIRSLGMIPQFFVDPGLFSRDPGSGMYRPLVLTSYALNYAAGGMSGRGYHWVNVALHMLVAVLAYALVRDILRDERGALLAALFVAVQPLASEPVDYISSRSESMAAAAVLGALLLYRRDGWTASWPMLLAYVAGLLSKSTAVTLPLLLVWHDLTLGAGGGRRRSSVPQSGHSAAATRSPLRAPLWRRHLGCWLITAVYVAGTGSLLAEATIRAPVRALHLHWLTQLKALVYYARLLSFPHPLSIEHQFAAARGCIEPAVWLSLALAVSAAWIMRHHRTALFWCGWMLLALLPTLVVPLNVLVNERRLYLPLVACSGLLVSLLGPAVRTRGVKTAVLVLVPMIALTVQRNAAWSSPEKLWTAARRVAPMAVRPYLRLGSVYRQARLPAKAEAAYRHALALDPLSAAAYNNLGNLYASEGLRDSAVAAYSRALRIAPRYVEAQINLAALRSRQGDTDGAIALLEAALRTAGPREELLNNLGTTYLRAGRYAAAEFVLRRALRLDPHRAGIYFNLGGALAGQGRYSEAVQAYRQALSLDPHFVRANYALASLLRARGDRMEAARACRRFLRQWHGDPALATQVQAWLRALESAD